MFAKGYFYFLLLLTVTTPLDNALEGFFELSDLFFLTEGITMLVGVYGYVYRKAFISPDFWKIFIVVSVSMFIYEMFWIYEELVIELGEQLTLLLTAIIMLLIFPAYYYLYQYRKLSIWQ